MWKVENYVEKYVDKVENLLYVLCGKCFFVYRKYRKERTPMTYKEVKEAIDAIVASPDTAQVKAAELCSALEADYTTMQTMQTKAAEDEARIRTLQDTNQRLYLMQTSKPDESGDDEELTGTAAVDAFVKEIMEK